MILVGNHVNFAPGGKSTHARIGDSIRVMNANDDQPPARPSKPAAEERPAQALAPAAERALAEAAARRAEIDRKAAERPKELHGRGGPEPTRYGDWEAKGITSDF